MISSKLRLAVLFFGSLAIISFSVAAQTARDVAKKVFPSVVIILMDDKNGQLASLGSGFLAEEDIIVTNFHVVEGASRGLVKLIGDNAKYEIQGVVATDEVNDLVLLKVKALTAPALNFGDSESLAVGDPVYAVGNPRGLEGTFSQGIVSSIRKLDSGSLLQITAPISPGSSGGPILDSTGKVIGVAVATYKGGQNLNFAIPVNSLRTLLKSKRDVQPLKAIGKPNAEKSILKDLGPRNTAGVVARKSEWVFPLVLKCSILNQLQQPVKNVFCIVVFYDDEDTPIDFKTVSVVAMIPAGLATWTDEVRVEDSTARYCSDEYRKLGLRKSSKQGRVEIRVLSFDLVE